MALTSIIYPHSWSLLGEEENQVWIWAKHDLFRHVHAMDDGLTLRWTKDPEYTWKKFTLPRTATTLEGLVNGVKSIVKLLNNHNRLVRKKEKRASFDVTFRYSWKSETSVFTLGKGVQVAMKPRLALALGYDSSTTVRKNKVIVPVTHVIDFEAADDGAWAVLDYPETDPDQKPMRQFNSCVHPREDVHMFQDFYVYSDIVDSHMVVGSNSRNLLRTFVPGGTPGLPEERNFLNPHYLPLRTQIINKIRLHITDDTGTTVPFQSGGVKATLHFRRQAFA